MLLTMYIKWYFSEGKLLSLMFKNKQMDLRQVMCRQLCWADVLKIVERPTC